MGRLPFNSPRLLLPQKTLGLAGDFGNGAAHGASFDIDRYPNVDERDQLIPPKTYRLVVAYDGTPFFGWQKTKSGPSIQEAIESALFQILQVYTPCEAASRTDRGVHAEGQVVQFSCVKEMPPQKLLLALNSHLPREIRIQSVELVDSSSHPTLDARSKTYGYFLCLDRVQLPFHRKFSWHYPYPIDLAKLERSAAEWIGTHDFGAFTTEPGENTVRTLFSIGLKPLPDHRLCIEITGDRFLYKMARTLVGTLAHIGSGKLPTETALQLLSSRDRKQAGVTAPAHGLFLQKVNYNNI